MNLYFGWRIVAALFLCMLATFGVSIFSFIILTGHMAADYGWTQTQNGTLVSAIYVIAPLALVAGPAAARFPAWRLVVGGLLAQAAAVALMSVITDISQLYILRILMGVGKILTVSAVPIIVAGWFSRMFATAVAFTWAGGSAGGFIMSPLTEYLATSLGWREASVVIACGMVAITLLAVVISAGARSPAELGCALDGDPTVAAGASAASAGPIDLKTALGQIRTETAVASLMALVCVCIGIASLGVMAQEPAFLRDAGVSAETAASILGLTALGALVGATSIGPILDRVPGWSAGLLVAGALYAGLATLSLVRIYPEPLVGIAGGICVGYAFGAGEVMWLTFTRRQFGEALFPFTYGAYFFLMQVGYALGGGVGGWGLDHLGPTGFVVLIAAGYLLPFIGSVIIRAAHEVPPLKLAPKRA